MCDPSSVKVDAVVKNTVKSQERRNGPSTYAHVANFCLKKQERVANQSLWYRGGGMPGQRAGSDSASTMPRDKKRAGKGSTLGNEDCSLPIYMQFFLIYSTSMVGG